MLRESVDGGLLTIAWEGPPGVVAAFSGRDGGVSEGRYASLNLGLRSGDDPARVIENRRRLCAAVGADAARTSSCRQVHSAIVHAVAEPPPLAFDDPSVQAPEGDALVTTTPGRALIAFAADCVPVVVASADGSAVGVCHAGWRGLVGGVVEATVAELPPGAKVAAVGPCAGPERYEVGREVAVPLIERFGEDVMRGRVADLAACAARALAASGVEEVDLAGVCTISDTRFFSHRRDGAPGGRQAVLAYLEEVR